MCTMPSSQNKAICTFVNFLYFWYTILLDNYVAFAQTHYDCRVVVHAE